MTNKRLLLVNTPYPRKVAGVPLNLLYLASAFKGTDVETRLLDLDIEPDDKRDSILEQRLRDYKPTHVGVTSYSPNYPESLDIMKKVKETNPSIIVISGGPHQIAVGSLAPKPEFIDYVVTDTFGEQRLIQILGIKKKVEGQELFPAFELLREHPNYQFDSELFEGRRMAQILTATGCSQKCNFCSAQLEYIPFSNDVIVQQLEKIIDLDYKAVFFNDPNFTNIYKTLQNGSYGRVKSLMRAFVDSGINQELIWGCQTKASMVNPGLLDLMAEAGCRYITYALENIDATSLKEMLKGITPDIVKQTIQWSRERAIKTGLYVMLGTIADTKADFENAKKTLNFVEELKPNYLSISILANYPMLDRSKHGERKHTELDYANQRYSRDPIWLNFDEGWGAFHPNATTEQAEIYHKEIVRKMKEKPEIWNEIRRF